MKFLPKQAEIFRVQIAPGAETLAIVVSSTEANAIRNVVTVCELGEDPEKKYRGLPTVVFASADETGLGKDLMAIASPYTVPKNCFLAGSREGVFPPALFEDLETCVKRIFGWAPWPD